MPVCAGPALGERPVVYADGESERCAAGVRRGCSTGDRGAAGRAGGKGPDFGHVGRVGRCEGVAGFSRSNFRGGLSFVVAVDGGSSAVKVGGLPRRLWAVAKRSEDRRLYALFDWIHRGDVLWEAWERVRVNRGAAGVVGVTLAFVEEMYGVRRFVG